MNFILYISNSIIPLTIFCIVGYAVLNKQDVYSNFVDGAKDGINTVIKILPTLIGLMVGVGVLSSSGFLNFITLQLSHITGYINIPSVAVPPMIIKMFSSSASTGLVLDIFKEYGPDSYEGLIVSIMMSCTETIFYTMSVYFVSAKVTHTRFTLAGAFISTFAGVIASIILAGFIAG